MAAPDAEIRLRCGNMRDGPFIGRIDDADGADGGADPAPGAEVLVDEDAGHQGTTLRRRSPWCGPGFFVIGEFMLITTYKGVIGIVEEPAELTAGRALSFADGTRGIDPCP